MVAPAIIAAGISGLASLGGGFMSASGAANANAQNIQQSQANAQFNAAQAASMNNTNMDFSAQQNAIARDYNWKAMTAQQNYGWQMADWSGKEAQKSMDFTERMSNTAYQRATADMRAAGLNPMLAYQQGGAGTPSGAQGTPQGAGGASISGASAHGSAGSGSAANVQNTQEELGRAVGRFASSAVDTYKNSEAAKLLSEEQKLVEQKKHESKSSENLMIVNQKKGMEETKRVEEETENAREQRQVIKAQVGNVNASSAAHYARAGLDTETGRQYGRYGIPGYGLGERVLRNVGDLSPGPVKLPESNGIGRFFEGW